MARNSGITKGKSHKEGGIPMEVKSTGQKIEVEGGEGIVNKYAMSSNDKFEFEGKEKTSCEIISELNQKKGDGVSFECNTVENKKYKFKKGGSLEFDEGDVIVDNKEFKDLKFYRERGGEEIEIVSDYDSGYAKIRYDEEMKDREYIVINDTVYYLDDLEVYAKGGSIKSVWELKERLEFALGDKDYVDSEIAKNNGEVIGLYNTFRDRLIEIGDDEYVRANDEFHAHSSNKLGDDGHGYYTKGGLNVGTIKGFYETMSRLVEKADEFIDKYEYRGSRGQNHPLAVNVKLRDVSYGIDDALDNYQTTRGNFSADKKEYIENELRLNEEWSYGVYNNFLDDELYSFKNYLLNRYPDILEDKQIYQSGRMGGWLVFSDGTELSTYIDELETILNENFSAEGDLVGEGHWSYGHPNHNKKITFKMFKEEAGYDDAIYYAKRIKILLADYKSVIKDIETAKKRLPQGWTEELDQKLHEHISSDKKIKKIFNYDDPEHAKGGKLKVKGLEEKAYRYWEQAQPKDINGNLISFDDFKEDLKKMSPDRIYAKGGVSKNERVEKDFPKNPENITKDELHEHFDLNNDGKVTLEEYAEHIDYHCENPEVLEDELEQAGYQRMFMYVKGGYVIKGRTKNKNFFATNKDMLYKSKAEAEEQAEKLNYMLNSDIIYDGKNSQEQLKEQYRLKDNIKEFYTEKQYEKGGEVKYLSDYINDKNSKLFKETGTFFAFSNEQFKEQMKEGRKYVDMGGGMITEKGNEEKLVKGLNKNYKEGIKQDLKENGKEKVILRELQNHEAFYTGEIEEAVETLKDYPGITKEDIMKSYRKNYSKYSDYAKGGKIDYINAYNARMDRAYKDMKAEGLDDYDSWQYIQDHGDFKPEEVAGYYLEMYKDKALSTWKANTAHKEQEDTIKKTTKILEKVKYKKGGQTFEDYNKTHNLKDGLKYELINIGDKDYVNYKENYSNESADELYESYLLRLNDYHGKNFQNELKNYAKGGFTTESQEAWSKMTTAQRIEKTKDERRVFPKGSAPYQRLSNMISVLEKKDYAKGGISQAQKGHDEQNPTHTYHTVKSEYGDIYKCKDCGFAPRKYKKVGKITGAGKSGLDKIKKTSKDNPSQMYKVTDDNYSNIGNFYLKNGKFAKMTVSNADYDFAYNKVSLRPKRDVIYKSTEIEGKGGYYEKGGETSEYGWDSGEYYWDVQLEDNNNKLRKIAEFESKSFDEIRGEHRMNRNKSDKDLYDEMERLREMKGELQAENLHLYDNFGGEKEYLKWKTDKKAQEKSKELPFAKGGDLDEYYSKMFEKLGKRGSFERILKDSDFDKHKSGRDVYKHARREVFARFNRNGNVEIDNYTDGVLENEFDSPKKLVEYFDKKYIFAKGGIVPEVNLSKITELVSGICSDLQI